MRARATYVAIAALATVAGCGSAESDGDGAPFGANPGAESPVLITAAGDFGIEETGAATLAAMAEVEPDVHVALGDFAYAGEESADLFCDLVEERMGSDVPFEIVSGNHEEDPGEDGLLRDFAACLPDRVGARGEYGSEYYFDIGRLARVILLSPNLTIDGEWYRYERRRGEPDEHLAWAEDAINDARALGTEWIIVGTHHNCLSSGRHPCEMSEDLLATLIERRVDVVLSGHDHTYQRSKQVAAGRPGCPRVSPGEYDRDCVADARAPYRQGKGTVFVISGAAGAFESHYPIVEGDPEHDYFVALMGANTEGKRHGFALLSVEPGRLETRFVASTPGSFSDRFVIRRDSP